MKIYDFKDSLNNINELKNLILEFYEMTFFLNKTYPGYRDWFSKQIRGCFNNERAILYTRDKDLITGLIFLKKTKEESKICTIYVLPEYKDHGIATMLIEESFKFLETSKPLTTMNKNKLEMFSKIIDKYNWVITDELDNLYNEGETEVILNGKRKLLLKDTK